MRLRRIKNIDEKIKKYEGLIVFDFKDKKGKWHEEFKNNHPIYLEIGMGKGNFIIANAIKNPNINYIGCELSDSVIYKAASKVDNLDNLLMINCDALVLEEVFSQKEIDKIFLNFSDPWPKTRHAKRRLTSENFLKIYENILRDDGVIEMKTDNRHLFEYSIMKFNEAKWQFEEISLDLHSDKDDIIMTEYEEKFVKQGQIIYYMKVRKKG